MICAGCGAPLHLAHTRYLECAYCARTYVNTHHVEPRADPVAPRSSWLCSTSSYSPMMLTTNCRP